MYVIHRQYRQLTQTWHTFSSTFFNCSSKIIQNEIISIYYCKASCPTYFFFLLLLENKNINSAFTSWECEWCGMGMGWEWEWTENENELGMSRGVQNPIRSVQSVWSAKIRSV